MAAIAAVVYSAYVLGFCAIDGVWGSAAPPVVWSCDDFLAAGPVVNLSLISSLTVSGRCRQAPNASSVVLDASAFGASEAAGPTTVWIDFNEVVLDPGPSIVVRLPPPTCVHPGGGSHATNGGQGSTSEAAPPLPLLTLVVTIRASVVNATSPYGAHPLGSATVALFDTVLTDDPASCKGGTRSSAPNVTMTVLDSVLSAVATESVSGGASIGSFFKMAGLSTVIGVAAGNRTADTMMNVIAFAALRSVMSAFGGSGGATVFCVVGMGRLAVLNVTGVAMLIDSSSVVAHRGGPSTGGNNPCGVLSIRNDGGVHVAYWSVVATNATITATADWDGWVGTAAVLSAYGSASLAVSYHAIVASVMTAFGVVRSGSYCFIVSVAANVAVVAGNCPSSSAEAAVPVQAVWGQLTEASPLYSMMVAGRDEPWLTVHVSGGSNITAALPSCGVAVNVGVMLLSDNECQYAGYTTSGTVQWGTSAAPISSLPVTEITQESVLQASGSIPQATVLPPPMSMVVAISNGSALVASTPRAGYALNIAAALAFGTGTVLWSVSNHGFLTVDDNVTIVSQSDGAVAAVLGAVLWTNNNNGNNAVTWSVASSSLVWISSNVALRAVSGSDDVSVVLGAVIVNNYFNNVDTVSFNVSRGSMVLLSDNCSVIVQSQNNVAVALGATLWNMGANSNGAARYAVTRNSLLLLSHGVSVSVVVLVNDEAIAIGVALANNMPNGNGDVFFSVADNSFILLVSSVTVDAKAKRFVAVALGAVLTNANSHGDTSLTWFQSNDSAIAVLGPGSRVASLLVNKATEVAVSLGTVGSAMGRLVVSDVLRWIAATDATIQSDGFAVGFGDVQRGSTLTLASGNATRVDVSLCGATIDCSQSLIVLQLTSSADGLPSVNGTEWFTVAACNATPSLLTSYVAAVVSATTVCDNAMGLRAAAVAGSNGPLLSTMRTWLLPAEIKTNESSGIVQSTAWVASLYDEASGLVSLAAIVAWNSLLSAAQLNVDSSNDLPPWQLRATTAPHRNPLSTTTIVPPMNATTSAAVNPTTTVTVDASAWPIDTATTPPRWPSSSPGIPVTIPPATSTTSPPSSKSSQTERWTTGLTAPAAATATSALSMPQSTDLPLLLTAVGSVAPHVLTAGAVAALVSSPQAASRGPQALRLMRLRSVCTSRRVNSLVSSMDPPDARAYVSVVPVGGSAASGALVTTSALLVASFVAAMVLQSPLCRCAGRPMRRTVVAVYGAVLTYFGPNVVTAAGAVLQSMGESAVTGSDPQLAWTAAVIGLFTAVALSVVSFLVPMDGVARNLW